MSKGTLPLYELAIQNGEYPFKNAHISRIFSVEVVCEIEKGAKALHRLLQTYHSIQSNLLINIVEIEARGDNETRLKYEYIDTPLAHYIRRFLHDGIQLKLERLYIALRDLANKFVLKNINVLKAISPKNIGVKMTDIYRESVSVQSPKNKAREIQMPDFKVFIDLSKCEEIERGANMARIVIDTDKMIYNHICKEINELLRRIQNEEEAHGKKAMKIYEMPKLAVGQDGLISFKRKEESQKRTDGELGFTNKIRRRKRGKDSPRKDNSRKKEESRSERASSTIVTSIQKREPKQLSTQVISLVERSRRTLQSFKQLMKQK